MSESPPSFCDLAMPGVRGLQPYQPGKPMAELEREYGVTDVIKLASNENPLGASPVAIEAAREALADVHRYPDGNGFDLKAALSAHHEVEPACITLGNGSNDVLDLVGRAFLGPGREAVFSAHAFAVYPIVTQACGARARVADANPADHAMPYGHDLDAMARLIGADARVVFVANPNNPTGTWLDRDSLEGFLARVPPNVVAVVDEAYFEYASDPAYPDASKALSVFPNLVVTRTFSKIYGLAGFRVGYALSSPEIADLLNRVRQPFNVNLVGQAAAAAALYDSSHVQRSVALNRDEMRGLDEQLKALGAEVLPSAGNFLCFRIGGDAAALYEGLLRAGVIVRPVEAYGLPGFLRVTVGLPAENRRFLEALQGLLGETA